MGSLKDFNSIYIEVLCNGSTDDFDSSSIGSNPVTSTKGFYNARAVKEKLMDKSDAKDLLIIILSAILQFLICGFILTALWNVLMPQIFGLAQIGYWQGVGLFTLSKFLFNKIEVK